MLYMGLDTVHTFLHEDMNELPLVSQEADIELLATGHLVQLCHCEATEIWISKALRELDLRLADEEGGFGGHVGGVVGELKLLRAAEAL